MKNMKRSVALLVAIALLIGCAAGGTMAWLTMKTDTVVNTFTTSDVTITLSETKGTLKDGNHEFKMVPGDTIAKDPTVTVKANSEKCYVFVSVEKVNNFDNYMTATMADGWTPGTGGAGQIPTTVYYRVVESSAEDKPFQVLKDDSVKVNSTLTKGDMSTIGENVPKLNITAYAIQFVGFADANAAWAEASK